MSPTTLGCSVANIVGGVCVGRGKCDCGADGQSVNCPLVNIELVSTAGGLTAGASMWE